MVKADLLSLIAQTMQKKCLSDLHGATAAELSVMLGQFPVSDFSNTQWGYALSYILNRPILLDDSADVRAFVESQID